MKLMRPLCLLGLLFLGVFCCFSTALAQQEITAEDVRAYIARSKQSGERWGAVEERYVLDNFGRSQLVQTIARWQARNRTKLTVDVKIMIIVDYLLTELRGMRALPLVLDSIARGEPSSFGKQLKTQVASTVVRQFQAAWVKIQVNVDSVDVEIDGKPLGNYPNGEKFFVVPAQPHVVLIMNGSSNCNQTITAPAGRTVVVPCTLQ